MHSMIENSVLYLDEGEQFLILIYLLEVGIETRLMTLFFSDVVTFFYYENIEYDIKMILVIGVKSFVCL